MPSVQGRYNKAIQMICDQAPAIHRKPFLDVMKNWFDNLNAGRKVQLNQELAQGFEWGYQGAHFFGFNVSAQREVRGIKRAIALLDCYLGIHEVYPEGYTTAMWKNKLKEKTNRALQRAAVGRDFSKPSARLQVQSPIYATLRVRDGKGSDSFSRDYLANQDELQEHFRARFQGADSDSGKICQQAVLRMGNIKWIKPKEADIYLQWERNNGLTYEHPEMNCWEGVLYLAYQAGVYRKEDLYNYFQNDKEEDTLQGHTAYKLLAGIESAGGVGYANWVVEKTDDPRPGDVFISPGLKETGTEITHVALYLGEAGGKKWVWHNGVSSDYTGCPYGHCSILPMDCCSGGMRGENGFHTAPWA